MRRADLIIRKIYDAILRPWELEQTLCNINRQFGCHLSRFIVQDISTHKIRKNYIVDFGACRPGSDIPAELADGPLAESGPDGSSDCLPSGTHWPDADPRTLICAAGGNGNAAGPLQLTTTFHRSSGEPGFTDEERVLLASITEHLLQVLTMIERSKSLRQVSLACEHALDALNSGVLLVDGFNRVLYANPFIGRLFPVGEVLFAAVEGLQPASLDEKNRVLTALNQVRESGQEIALAIGYRHPGRSRHFRAILNIAPQAAGLPPRADNDAAPASRLRIQVTCQDEQESVTPAQLSQIFGLTHAEGRLAHALSSGLSIDEFARESRISVATARTQLRSVLLKTGQNRQQDLVRLLARIPLQGP